MTATKTRKGTSRRQHGPAPAAKAARHGQASGENGEVELRPSLGAERRPLHRCVSEALAGYFSALDGEEPAGLYELVMTEVERPLLESVMTQVCGNQTRAADMLGLNRGTLRKKLKHHGLLES